MINKIVALTPKIYFFVAYKNALMKYVEKKQAE